MNVINKTLGIAVKHLSNIGLGQLPGMTGLYTFAWRHFGAKGVLLTDVDGFKLYVIGRDWAVAPAMLFAHTWEPAETAIFKRYIKTGMTVVDAGAYIGYYSVLASKLVGSEGSVYTFEPSPESLEVLHKNIGINECENVTVFESAVSDKSGYTTFYPNPRNLSGSTMFDGYSTIRGAKDPKIEIPVMSLDDAIGDGKVDFVKMDIEGGETKALKGMQRVIKNNPDLKMIVELFPIGLERVGSSLEEFVGTLQRDFRLFTIERDGSVCFAELAEIQKAVKKSAVINLFCEGRGK